MKKFLFVLIALLTVFAFATGAVAAEKKATAPQAGKVSGTVTAYIAASQADKTAGTISVKDAKEKNWAFDVLPDTKITGEVTKGANSDRGLQEGRRQNDCDFYYRDRSEETRGAEDKVVGVLMHIRKGMILWKRGHAFFICFTDRKGFH